MANVVKRGNLEVKRKNKIGPTYKRKYVILRRDVTEGTKLVEVCDNDCTDSEKECIPLKGIWTVQDREAHSKKRFAFELVIGAHVVMTFSCPSLLERNEWTESFRILNSISSSSPVPRIDDMYNVILEHNIFSAEIGFSGPCLLRIQDGSIVLYSEDGLNKLHHWAFDNVENISMAGDQVILDVYRHSNSDSLMQFRFNTDFDSSRCILIACSMLLESKNSKRASSLSLNSVGFTVSTTTDAPPTKTQSLSRSFLGSVKQPNKPSHNIKEDKIVRRAKSFTDKSSFAIRRSLSPEVGFKGSVHSVASQESYAINRPLSQTKKEGESSPPPVPPRAPRRPRSIGLDYIDHKDPDYSYIKDDIDGATPKKKNGNETDQQLDDLLRDIEEENRIKKRRATLTTPVISPYAETGPTRKSKTLTLQNSSRAVEDFEKKRKEFQDIYGRQEASDYLEPVPSKSLKEKRSSNPSQYKEFSTINGISPPKRYSSSSEYSSSSFIQSISSSSSHDYHTIPDKPAPQHSHTSSMDSTHNDSTTTSDRKSNWGRTLSGSDDPPSPPLPPRPSYLTQIPPQSPTKLQSSKKGDISPYATTRGIVISSTDVTTITPGPPLPPRSPNKHYRERVASSSSHGRCQKCNGVKLPRCSTTLHQPHRLPPSPPLDKEQITTNGTINILPHLKPRPQSAIETENTMLPKYGYGNEIDSALALLDDCVRGLNILDVDMSNNKEIDTSPKSSSLSIQTDIDKAIKCAQEVGSDLSLVPVKRAATVHYSNSTQNVYNPHVHVPPRSQVSLVYGGTQTTPKRQYPVTSSSLSSGNIQNGGRILNDHRLPLTRYHSNLLPSELSSNTVRAHDIKYN